MIIFEYIFGNFIFAKRMRSIVGLLLKHARAGLGYVKNFVKNTNQPEPKKFFTLKTRIKNLGSDPRAIWCGFLRGFVDVKKGNDNGRANGRANGSENEEHRQKIMNESGGKLCPKTCPR